MSGFNHYPDMNKDGKIDLYDSGAYHNLMDEDKRKSGKNTHKSSDAFSVTTKKELWILLGVLWVIYIIVDIIAK